MSAKDKLAFPQHGYTSSPEVLERMRDKGGMTMRQWYKGMALQGLLASGSRGPEQAAAPAASCADALLAEDEGRVGK